MTNTTKACTLVLVLLAPLISSAQTSAQTESMAADIASVQTQIQEAQAEEAAIGPGLIKTLISLRLATLRQTLAILDQRTKAAAAHTTLRYTVDGQLFVPPADSVQQIAAVEQEIVDNAQKVTQAQANADRYTGGLIRATALATVGTLRQTQAMLEQKRLALKYGLPQFVGFKDSAPSASTTSAQPTPRAVTTSAPDSPKAAPQTDIPADCLKLVFGAFCLGAPTSSLPPNPAQKTAERWIYMQPQPTVAEIVEDRLGSVARLYSPGTWLTYKNVETELVEKYGLGKDLSYYPSYADDASSRETAIQLKKGRAAQSWQQQGFTIQLKWESAEHVVLVYFHDELTAKKNAKAKDQF